MTDDSANHEVANTHRDGGPTGFEKARAAALAEMQRRPRARSWKRDALSTMLLVLASTTLVLLAGAFLSIVEFDRLKLRWLPLLLLIAVQSLGVYGAIAPGRTTLRRCVVALAVVAAIAIIAGRGAGGATTTPPYACSTSHLAIDLIPLAFVLFALRKFSVTFGRSMLAGLAAAATGAIAGELSCGRGWSHVLIHHVGAAVLVMVACVLLSRARPPQTFAP